MPVTQYDCVRRTNRQDAKNAKHLACHHDSFDALAKRADVEVDQQPERLSRGLQVREHLGQVKGQEAVDRFQLDDEALANEQIETSLTDWYLLVVERDSDLASKGNAAKSKLDGERLFVDGFEESGTQMAMDFESRVHDYCREVVEFLIRFNCFGVLGVLAVHTELSAADRRGCANLDLTQ